MLNSIQFSPLLSWPSPTISKPHTKLIDNGDSLAHISRRFFILTTNFSLVATISQALTSPPQSLAASNSFLSGIASTKSWFQFYGDGFAIRAPPNFQDIQDPQDDNEGLALYGDKVKPRTFAARFASPDGSEVLSVVIRPTNQLKITFLEAVDITDLGSLKDAAKIFVPGGARLYSA